MKFFGNTKDLINWTDLIAELETKDPAYIGPDNSFKDYEDIVGQTEIVENWNRVGVKTVTQGGTNNWGMYIPGLQFDNKIIEDFSNFVNADPTFAWIARITPGNMAHWHWDTSSKADYFDSIPNMVRYCCFIEPPQSGHVFLTEDKAFYKEEQGNIWQWPDRKMWHGGVNFGFTNKYMLHFFGPSR